MTASSAALAGRRALVTGGDAGIGRAIALGLAGAGADLIVHHHGHADEAAQVVAKVEAMGKRAELVAADFTQAGCAQAVAREVLDAPGDVDILIANAAIERRGAWEEVSDAEIEAHVRVNFVALLHLLQAFVPPMAARGWGRVVALGSVLAARPRAETLVYAALKSAQTTALRAIARDVAARGVTVNVVSPGAIRTERTAARYDDPDFAAAVVTKIPCNRPGTPEDIVGPVLMLCSDGGSYVTGADIPIDGGWSIGDALH